MRIVGSIIIKNKIEEKLMKTKTLSCLLTVAILLSTFLLGIPAVAAEPASWDGRVATSFAGGAGTADDPWQISKPLL